MCKNSNYPGLNHLDSTVINLSKFFCLICYDEPSNI